jgi:hypothetical protein
MRERWLFSYVVDHDFGIAPNPTGNLCTLAHCKFSHSHKRNLVEMAQVGDWVVGTGGSSAQSAGHGRMIYAMRVTRKISLGQYSSEPRYAGRADRKFDRQSDQGRYALIADEFYYFGRDALNVAQIPGVNVKKLLEKRGPGYRRDFTESFILGFEGWIRAHFHSGVHGEPCGGRPAHWRIGTFAKCAGSVCAPTRKKRQLALARSKIC